MTEHEDMSRLYRDAAQPEPSAALDDAILAAARQAAGAPPQRTHRANRWRVPFALAATVVLTVSLTVMMRDQQQLGEVVLPPPRSESSSPAVATGASIPAAKATQPAAAEPVARPAWQPAPSPPVQSTPSDQPAPAPAADDRARSDNLVQPMLRAAPEAQGALSVDAAIAVRKEEKPPTAAAPAMPALMEKRGLTSSFRDKAAAESVVGEQQSPERWIADIRELKRNGSAMEAGVMLSEFRKRFPDYTLPDDLK